MGDDLCCCGVDGMGWKVNKGNVVHIIKGNAEFTPAQRTQDVGILMANMKQQSLSRMYGKMITFEKLMQTAARTKNELIPLIPEDVI